MRILVAEDDTVSRQRLGALLARWGHEVTMTGTGNEAWQSLQAVDAPSLALLDWEMPGVPGPEVCRRAREAAPRAALYLILLTGRTSREDTIAGLESGADDYLTKPFDPAELRARIGVGIRVLELQQELARRVVELERAVAEVDRLHGLLPICSYCKKVRTDGDSWQQIEAYVSAHSTARFSHGVCPHCLETVLRPQVEAARALRRGTP
jgi:DNA-binding response OmpR family regulator